MRNNWKLSLLLLACLLGQGCSFLDERAMIPNGRIVATTAEGKKRYEKEWLNKKRHGTWRDYNAEGILIAEYSYDQGAKIGIWKKFFPDGKLQNTVTYRADKEEGKAESWYPNGKKAFSGNFLGGRKHGVFVTWNEEGQITDTIEWENDVNMEGKFKPTGSQ